MFDNHEYYGEACKAFHKMRLSMNPYDGYCREPSDVEWATSITPPSNHHFIGENTAYNCYILEQEGELNTRLGKLNQFAKQLAQTANPNDFAAQTAIAASLGIDTDDLTLEEISYLENETSRLYQKF